MSYQEHFASNNNVLIHYLDSIDYDTALTPLVYIPGALGFAEQFVDEMKVLSPRRSISLSLRGRGKSDAPFTGYSFDEHVTDIRAVIEDSKVTKSCLMAYSMGVPYTIKFASLYPEQLKGLILCDYQAKYPQIPESWPERVITNGYVKEDRHHVAKRIQKDSEEVYLWDDLKRITCPVLIVKGGTEHAHLQEEAADKYKIHLENVDIVEFSESGHELWVPDYDRLINTIKQFLVKIDTGIYMSN